MVVKGYVETNKMVLKSYDGNESTPYTNTQTLITYMDTL